MSRSAVGRAGQYGTSEIVAIILIAFGGILTGVLLWPFGLVPLLGLVVGVILLWRSPAWTSPAKLIGTFALLAAFSFSMLFWVLNLMTAPACDPGTSCTSSSVSGLDVVAWIFAIAALIIPLALPVYLYRQLAR